MFGTRRLAKRSIVGTQVCVPWIEDGRYYPGKITSTSEWANGQEVYNVYFPKQKVTKTFQDRDLIGPGFQTITIAHLRKGQKVFITHNSRETSGTVVHHDRDSDDVTIAVELAASDPVELVRRLEDVRLVESRRSARLQDHRGTNYSQRAEQRAVSHSIDVPPSGKHRYGEAFFIGERKQRAVSRSIDVPPSGKHRRPRQRTTSLPSGGIDEEESILDDIMDLDDEEEEERLVGGRSPDSESGSDEENTEVMDATMAAMVLTSLSCSPLSPGHRVGAEKDNNSPVSTTGSSMGSSGVWGMSGKSPSPHQSDRSTPTHGSSQLSSSCPQYLSSSAPDHQLPFTGHHTHRGAEEDRLFGTPGVDEGIEVDDTEAYFNDEFSNGNGSRKRRLSTRTVFKCLWPGCVKLYNTCSGIEGHVRHEHLGPSPKSHASRRRNIGYDSDDSSESLSDHEEEFYYTEVEVSVDTVTQTFADMHTSSPPTQVVTPTSGQGLSDHDYQKKSMPLCIPDLIHSRGGGSLPGSLGSSQPKVARTMSWQNASGKTNKTSSLLPTKHILHHKKPRTDTKKCRKYYGMENRDLWCTQCKWKKACTRFLDYYNHANKMRFAAGSAGAMMGSYSGGVFGGGNGGGIAALDTGIKFSM